MGLENKVLRFLAVGTLVSAATIFSALSYRSFERGDNTSLGTYATLTAISAALAITFQRYRSRKTNSEETGFFGVPDQVIIDGWKRDSGRYKSP